MSVSELLQAVAPTWTNLNVQSLNAVTITAENIIGPTGFTGTTGAFDDVVATNIFVDNIYPKGGNTGIKFIEPALAPDPCFGFYALGTSNTQSSLMYIEDSLSAFNHPNAAILRLNGAASVTYGGGTNFIRCQNLAAMGQPYNTSVGFGTGPSGTFANTIVYNIDSEGIVTANGYLQWSSEEYKKNIDNLILDSKKLKDVNPRFFHYKPEADSNRKRVGMLYEEMEQLCPEICHNNNDGKKIDLNAEVGVVFALLKDIEQRLSVLESKFNL